MVTPRARSRLAVSWILSTALHLAVLAVALFCRIPAPPLTDEVPIALISLPPALQVAAEFRWGSAHLPTVNPIPLDIIADEPSAEAADDPLAVEGSPDITRDRELGGEFLTLCLGASGGAAGKSGALRAGGRKRRGGAGAGGAHVVRCLYGQVNNASQIVFNLVVLPLGAGGWGWSSSRTHSPDIIQFAIFPDRNDLARGLAIDMGINCIAPFDDPYPAGPRSLNRLPQNSYTILSWTDLELAAAGKRALEYPHLRMVLPRRSEDRLIISIGGSATDGPGLAALNHCLASLRHPELGAALSIEITATRMPARLVRHIVSLLANKEANNPDAAEEPWSCPQTKAMLAVWIKRLGPTATAQRGTLDQDEVPTAVHFP